MSTDALAPPQPAHYLYSGLSVSANQARDNYVPAADGPEVGDNVTSLLLELESERRLFNVPVITFLVFLAGFGVSGNVCVLHVYRTRFRKTAGSFFITTLALLDLLSAALCVPFDIYDLSYPYTHPAPVPCRIFRFLEYFTAMAAGLVLTCVAFSRYFKILHPFHLYSAGQARSLVIVMVTMALCTCWPELVLRGTRTVHTRVPGILGWDCSLSDWASVTVYPLIYYIVLLAIFFLCFTIMLAFYSRIVCVVWKRSRTRIGERVPSNRLRANRNTATSRRGGGEGREERGGGEEERAERRWSSDDPRGSYTGSEGSLTSSQISISTISKPGRSAPYYPRAGVAWGGGGEGSGRKRRRRSSQPPSHLGRTTRMLGLVTFVALLGYVPFLTVQVVALAGAGFRVGSPLSYGEELAFQFCLKSHYLSSAANPLIYSVLSPAFRKESLVALKRAVSALKHCCKTTDHSP